jgi:hypothetical protein
MTFPRRVPGPPDPSCRRQIRTGRVSAETACEILHKVSPRNAMNPRLSCHSRRPNLSAARERSAVIAMDDYALGCSSGRVTGVDTLESSRR